MNLGFLQQGSLCRDLNILVERCIKNKQLYLVDLLSLLPTDLFYFLLKDYKFWPIIRINRLLKINRVLELSQQTEASTNYPYLFRIFSIYITIILMVHFNSCIFFLVHNYTEAFYLKNKHIINVSFIRQYAHCFHRTMLQLTAISNLDPPTTSFEMMYMICNYLIGVLLFGIIVGNVTNIIDDLNMKRTMVTFFDLIIFNFFY